MPLETSFVNLNGMPGVSSPRPPKKSTEGTKLANASANATANATEAADSETLGNATASTTDANMTGNSTGNATIALPAKADRNSAAWVMPYASAMDEKVVKRDEDKNIIEPYRPRPAKYASNYPMNNDHRKYAAPAPKDD